MKAKGIPAGKNNSEVSYITKFNVSTSRHLLTPSPHTPITPTQSATHIRIHPTPLIVSLICLAPILSFVSYSSLAPRASFLLIDMWLEVLDGDFKSHQKIVNLNYTDVFEAYVSF